MASSGACKTTETFCSHGASESLARTAGHDNVKAAVLKLASKPSLRLSSDLDASDRLLLAEQLPRLEAASPEPTPTTSALLEGEWTFELVGAPPPGILPSPTREAALLLYSGGFSPGVFGLSLSQRIPSSLLSLRKLALVVRPAAPRAEVTAEFSIAGGNNALSVSVFSKLEVSTSQRICETWSDVIVNGRSIALPLQFQYKRTLFITYLDDSLLVFRDEAGCPSILTRKPAEDLVSAAPVAAAHTAAPDSTPVVVPVVDVEA